MRGVKLLIARSEARAKAIHERLELGEGWRCVGYFAPLCGLRVERAILCDFDEQHTDLEKATQWLNDVVRCRLDAGCANNVWTI